MRKETYTPINVIDFKTAVKNLKKRQVEKRIYFGLHETVKLRTYLKDRLGEEHELTDAFRLPKHPSTMVTLKVSRRKLNQIGRLLLDEENEVTRDEVGEILLGLDSKLISIGGPGSRTIAYEAFCALHYGDINRQQALNLVS